MKRVSPTIGVAVRYDLQAAPHARTFFRTLALARNEYPRIAALRFVFADDLGTREGALRAAEHFERAGARIVIGHMSSDAAQAAVSRYAQSGTLLLLPTATASALTTNGSPVLRLCAPDCVLAGRLVAHLASHGWRRLRIACEPTRHGQQLAADITDAASLHGIAVLNDGDDASPGTCSVFVGGVQASADYVLKRRDAGCTEPIFLTDDAASASLAERIGDAGHVSIVGFAPAYALARGEVLARSYVRWYAENPGVNALETFAALHIAAQLAAESSIDPQRIGDMSFDTPTARVRFSARQNRDTAHAIWSLKSGRLMLEQVIEAGASNESI
ncbi:ABC transporter substrate-binding protein [Burkholderia sp. TSV86]|uniref:ABC transporter substrate-binding protein n=1 Tax=Burkholderia sp. TSV86 TaxID=1385594 RepID=UPI000757B485|nr:ABC transporter substrate-binding protein [Burkholderia sp. TSV86]KVE32417.1 hypothetical protein WS68_14680 [Burkholderia sp. TSV86]